jgi:hypothetical protein
MAGMAGMGGEGIWKGHMEKRKQGGGGGEGRKLEGEAMAGMGARSQEHALVFPERCGRPVGRPCLPKLPVVSPLVPTLSLACPKGAPPPPLPHPAPIQLPTPLRPPSPTALLPPPPTARHPHPRRPPPPPTRTLVPLGPPPRLLRQCFRPRLPLEPRWEAMRQGAATAGGAATVATVRHPVMQLTKHIGAPASRWRPSPPPPAPAPPRPPPDPPPAPAPPHPRPPPAPPARGRRAGAGGAGRGLQLRHVLAEALRDFRLDEGETEWSSLSFALWLSPDGIPQWHNGAGRNITFDMLVERLVRNHKRMGVCQGHAESTR